MARPHIEYVQSQELSWNPPAWSWPGSDVLCKILSEDDTHGGCSCVLQYPAGWVGRTSGYLSAAEEILVLQGSLEINGEHYEQDCYAYLPAGYPRESARSESGAVVLTFYAQRPEFLEGATDYEADKLIRKLDAYAMRWECDGMDPAYAEVGLRWKMLRVDEANQDVTMLIYTPPHLHPEQWKGPQERHDCVEEMFLISGDFLSNVGLMAEGAYFWRPPGIAHGPYGSRAGNLTLIRTLGHELVNNWTEHEVEISRTPKYQPYLPDSLADMREREWQRPPAY